MLPISDREIPPLSLNAGVLPPLSVTSRRVVLVLLPVVALWLGGSAHAQDPLQPGRSVPSVDESLQRLDGTSVSFQQLMGTRGTVVIFWSNRCPWIDRYEERVQKLASEFQAQGIRFVLVNANSTTDRPGEGLEPSRERSDERNYSATYVRDPTAALARVLGAGVTPQAFVFDPEGTLVYTGAIDDSPSGAEQAEEAYLRQAVEALVEGTESPVSQQKPYGCTLKYPDDQAP